MASWHGRHQRQATFEVRDYETEESCPKVEVSGNAVSGGCLVESVSGPWEVWAGGWLTETCSSSFAMRMFGGHIQIYMEFELELGPNGELLGMLQTNEYGGIKNAEFTSNDPESILITDVP